MRELDETNLMVFMRAQHPFRCVGTEHTLESHSHYALPLGLLRIGSSFLERLALGVSHP